MAGTTPTINVPLDAYTVIPMESFSAFRKAILAMKDLGTFVTLRLRSPTQLEVSSMDDFRATGLYTVVPVFRTNNMPVDAYGFLAATDLVFLASILKKHPGAIRMQYLSSVKSFRFTKLNSNQHTLLQPSLSQPECLHPRLVDLVCDTAYYWIDMVSVDILTNCVHLSVGSGVIDVVLLSDGRMIWSNEGDLGKIEVSKQLATKFQVSQTMTHVTEKEDEQKENNNPTIYVLSRTQAVIKFAAKALTNSLVNCSQKTLKLGLPKTNVVVFEPGREKLLPIPTIPIVLKFFLSRPDIWGYFLMFPEPHPIRHSFDFPTQKPLFFIDDSLAIPTSYSEPLQKTETKDAEPTLKNGCGSDIPKQMFIEKTSLSTRRTKRKPDKISLNGVL